jgi:uncharacterized glyoxalase superfamily protein PhnB
MLAPILSCRDVDASIIYYTRCLGFTLNWRKRDWGGKTTFASLTLGTAEVMLAMIEGIAPISRGHLGAGVQLHIDLPQEVAIDELYEWAKRHGASITQPLEEWAGKARSFSVNDCDGYQYRIAQSAMAPRLENAG